MLCITIPDAVVDKKKICAPTSFVAVAPISFIACLRAPEFGEVPERVVRPVAIDRFMMALAAQCALYLLAGYGAWIEQRAVHA